MGKLIETFSVCCFVQALDWVRAGCVRDPLGVINTFKSPAFMEGFSPRPCVAAYISMAMCKSKPWCSLIVFLSILFWYIMWGGRYSVNLIFWEQTCRSLIKCSRRLSVETLCISFQWFGKWAHCCAIFQLIVGFPGDHSSFISWGKCLVCVCLPASLLV